MKKFHNLAFLNIFLTLAFGGSLSLFLSTDIYANGMNETQNIPMVSQRLFASPEEAVKALKDAVAIKDKDTLRSIFGPEVKELLTGDKVQDENNAKRFADAMEQGYRSVKESENKIIIQVGANSWPMPIPLVKSNGQWRFDTAAGKEEIINRHIGKDEISAISVCKQYVTAQQLYISVNKDLGIARYAQKFESSPGKKDGLYWVTTQNQQDSPFTLLAAKANADGYVQHKNKGPQPFHGYFFKILTRQGKDAPGGAMNYLRDGNLTGGFALVAYPEYWDKSGVMTFIINHEGKVFQKNLGPKTVQLVKSLKEYNPDNTWMLVKDNDDSIN